ncbi:DNA internalization-related competence protein ComEC/Rec2 [Photobacterium aphoticum]
MRCAAGIALGLLSLHFWPSLPEYNAFVTVVMIGSIVLAYFRQRSLIWVAVGALLANIAATSYVQNVQLAAFEPENTTIVGEVRSLLNPNNNVTLFEFTSETRGNPPNETVFSSRLQLRWQQGVPSPVMRQGERWQLTVKLRPPHGRVNSAGFDRERHFVGKGIHASGIVVAGTRLSANKGLQAWRQTLFERAVQQTDGLAQQGYLLALGFGFRDALNDHDWALLRDSGLAHLMAISGLHIGLAVMLGWWLGGGIRFLLGDHARWQWWPLWAAIVCGAGYAWLAGFSLPTQRALMMSVLVLCLLRGGVRWPGSQVMVVVFAISLALNPLASYSAGFWLSFSAVWVILFAYTLGIGRRESQQVQGQGLESVDDNRWPRWMRAIKAMAWMQVALLLFMLPVQWLWFGGFAPLAPMINFIAIPWVSMVTVPFVLAAIVLSFWETAAVVLWQAADFSLYPVLSLASLASEQWWRIAQSQLPLVFGLVLVGGLLWLLPWRRAKVLLLVLLGISTVWALPPERRGRVIPSSALSSFSSFQSAQPWQVDMLDVGHGLAIIISRGQQAVVYDTGDQWPMGSIASSVIEPVLKARGITQLDGLILSHADSDHAGGAAYLSERFTPGWQRSSDERAGYLPCVRGEAWHWQGLSFEVLWPPKRVKRAANPHSCVILISDASVATEHAASVLLTGDIDAISELLLAQQYPDLQADVVFVPHHGSATSSTATWLSAMQPQYGLVSVARYSPWALPAPSVKQRYLAQGVEWLSTAEAGQVSLRIAGRDIDVVRYRQDKRAAWYRSAALSASPSWMAWLDGLTKRREGINEKAAEKPAD